MARTELQKFRLRLGLAAFIRHKFGIQNPFDRGEVADFYRDVRVYAGTGQGKAGISVVAQFLTETSEWHCLIPAEDLRRYDFAITNDVEERLSSGRDRTIELLYFQRLGALASEYLIERVANASEALATEINEFFEVVNADLRSYKGTSHNTYKHDPIAPEDLRKLAFWMATGSGKTLLMHLHYFQAMRHFGPQFDNILLITPNAGLSKQHVDELDASGIDVVHFHKAAHGPLAGHGPDVVKVIEITQLVEDKDDEGKRVDVAHLEGNNLVFVDEGHKGASGTSWMSIRNAVASDGFTFEYSATFGQAFEKDADLQKEYGQAIAFTYSYPRYHDDGYGKDYRILNLDHDFDPGIRKKYLLANLLVYFQQHVCFAEGRETFADEYNIERPLLMFIGASVSADKTKSNVSAAGDQAMTDVQKLVDFLDDVLRNPKGWAVQTIEELLVGDHELKRLFGDTLEYLAERQESAKQIYKQLLETVFHAKSSAGLLLANIKSAKGEIGLKAGKDSEDYFGVIDIGNDTVFLQKMAENDDLSRIEITDDDFRKSLFATIDSHDSSVEMLLGSRKFIEGWNSYRVSSMGLMNFGRQAGPMIVQLFGRGIRLRGKDGALKRSTELDEISPPPEIGLLETLHIFGVRADYMATFKEYLEKEGIDTSAMAELPSLPVRTNEEFLSKGLLSPFTPRDAEQRFLDEVAVQLADSFDASSTSFEPSIELAADVAMMEVGAEEAEQSSVKMLNAEEAKLYETYGWTLHWERIEARIHKWCRHRDYDNLQWSRRDLERIIRERRYQLNIPEEVLRGGGAPVLQRVERLLLRILKEYISSYYGRKKKRFVDAQIDLEVLRPYDEQLLDTYRIRCRVNEVSDEQVDKLEELLERLNDPDEQLYATDDGLPARIHFDKSLYLPLLVEHSVEDGQLPLTFTPPGLNTGEAQFVRDLDTWVRTDEATELLDDWELYLLRNGSRGRGVSFLVPPDPKAEPQNVFPDFIVWLVSDGEQRLVFVEPHGLRLERDAIQNAKVQLHRYISEYQDALGLDRDTERFTFHSYVVSVTSRKGDELPDKPYSKNGVVFIDEDDYLNQVFEDVLSE